ncbi:MAG: GNAT family N-acetyltransferase [Bacteroidota bacterium]
MFTILKFKKSDEELFAKAFAIRTEVFVKGLNIDPLLEADEYDAVAHHFLLLENDIPLATARWRETEKGIKLERFAVPAAHRNKGIGAFLLKEILADVIPLKEKIYLHSQYTAINLYLKNGFKIEGPSFEEAGIKHYCMVHEG